MTVAATSFLVAVISLPGAIYIFRRFDTIDVPSGRSSHAIPTPRGGGAALVLGVLIAVGVTDGGASEAWPYLALMVVYGGIGLADDLRGGVGIGWRLGGCLLAAVALVPPALTENGTPVLALVGIVLVVGFTNSFNFMDGVNAISAIHLVVYGALLSWIGGEVEFSAGRSIGLALIGAGVAFLPFNAVAAKIFIGDVGSYAFGGTAAFVATGTIGAGAPVSTVIPVLFPYIADTSLTMLRRMRRGDRWWAPHREHAYQRMVDLGLSHVEVACLVGAVSALCGLLGALSLDRPGSSIAFSLLAAALALGYAATPLLMARSRPNG